MKIGIIGAGVVGEATGNMLKTKYEVLWYDKFKQPWNSVGNLQQIVQETALVFLCVPTPMQPNGKISTAELEEASAALLNVVRACGRNPQDVIVVVRSTAVPGTAGLLARQFPFRFASNPEFLREKHAEEDMKNTRRVVIGAQEQAVHEKLVSLYREVFPQAHMVCVDCATAEMIKYASNVTLASQVAIANEIYRICRAAGVEYGGVRQALLQDERIGSNTLVPGPDGEFGFGGKCFPKDFRALLFLAQELGVEVRLLHEVWGSNLRARKNHD